MEWLSCRHGVSNARFVVVEKSANRIEVTALNHTDAQIRNQHNPYVARGPEP